MILLCIILINNLKKSNNYTNYKYYKKKEIMTNYERYFYNIFIELENDYFIRIQPQVNLASIIDIKNNKGNIWELFRNVDFAIFTRDYSKLLLLIEINDKTHAQPKRAKRDKKVREIVDKADIKLITFYSSYPNDKLYVINRIKKELNLK